MGGRVVSESTGPTDREMALEAEVYRLRQELAALGPKTELELLGEISRAVLRLEGNLALVQGEVRRVNQRLATLPCDRCPPLSVAL